MHDGVYQFHVDEVNLSLCRVDIDINFLRIYLNIKEIARETILRNQFFVGVFHSVMQVSMLDETMVHEEILLATGLFRKLRFHDESVYRHRLRYLIDWQ